MYFTIGIIIFIIYAVIFSLPLLEWTVRKIKRICSDFINEEETEGEIEIKLFNFFYKTLKNRYDKKNYVLEFDNCDYMFFLIMALICSIIIPFVWPVVVVFGIIYIVLVVLRKIKRLEKLIKSAKEKDTDKE